MESFVVWWNGINTFSVFLCDSVSHPDEIEGPGFLTGVLYISYNKNVEGIYSCLIIYQLHHKIQDFYFFYFFELFFGRP